MGAVNKKRRKGNKSEMDVCHEDGLQQVFSPDILRFNRSDFFFLFWSFFYYSELDEATEPLIRTNLTAQQHREVNPPPFTAAAAATAEGARSESTTTPPLPASVDL